MKKIACFALFAVLLAGCGGTSGEATSDAPKGSNADKGATKKAQKPEAKNPKFGGAFTWKDGLALTVSKPQKFTPSEYAAADKANGYVMFEIRLVNKTGKPYDPSLLYATLQSGNEEAEQVFDSEKLGDDPTTKLLDGRELKYKIAFGVKDPGDLVMEISPDAGLDYKGAIFTN